MIKDQKMKRSAGLLLYRKKGPEPEVFLVHPGGPFWKNKDEGAWSVPKGEFDENEDALSAARREFREETGIDVTGSFIPLKPVWLKSGKEINAWAVESDIDAEAIVSNDFSIEWPPRSGRMQHFPEVDRADWFDIDTALMKINTAQAALIVELRSMIV